MTSAKRSIAKMLFRLTAGGLIAANLSIAAAQEPSRNFIIHETPKPIAEIQFEDADGRSRSLNDFRGKVVLLNIWATWCTPCRKEMPTLDRLQTALGGIDFEVVALSIDRRMDAVRKFFAEVGIQRLAMYLDTSARATRQLGAVGLPTTLLIDREAREIARLIGPAEWDSPEIAAFISCVIAGGDAAHSSNESEPTATSRCGKRSLGVPAGNADSKRQP
ncbi:TlpA family protein disulfide reductase [Bradyrhizobium sp. 200]|uniref:TlpA family protein disulfide reductase n=1 Tax=Bradyrhizobium sp. 200 TaxID=2782665 RepID=UPI001FFE783E|nr:TlpA disulfide reductase family protein [Bradyrhizobium sp. 200]UPJ50498.1 TlpA family protein disulfide reductase [Bradyrhizobium sp. 200]